MESSPLLHYRKIYKAGKHYTFPADSKNPICLFSHLSTSPPLSRPTRKRHSPSRLSYSARDLLNINYGRKSLGSRMRVIHVWVFLEQKIQKKLGISLEVKELWRGLGQCMGIYLRTYNGKVERRTRRWLGVGQVMSILSYVRSSVPGLGWQSAIQYSWASCQTPHASPTSALASYCSALSTCNRRISCRCKCQGGSGEGIGIEIDEKGSTGWCRILGKSCCAGEDEGGRIERYVLHPSPLEWTKTWSDWQNSGGSSVDPLSHNQSKDCLLLDSRNPFGTVWQNSKNG